MLGLFGAVLTASLIGSPHCAGMCGPLAILASSTPNHHGSWKQLFATYHLSRLLGYLLLGMIAGSIGAALDLSGTLLGVQRTAALLAGGAMIVIGIFAVVRFWGGQAFHFSLPAPLQRMLREVHQRLNRLTPVPRAAGIGLLTVFLPCGWLYAFVITAAGTAHPLFGGVVMLSFWLGTLPALTVVMIGVRQLAGRWRIYLPVATSILLIVTGTYLVADRAWVEYSSLGQTKIASSLPADKQVTRVSNLSHQEMPCCHVD